jgi:appr-1-p processing enzyme family
MTNREILGDITRISHGLIMHQVNCQNVMGAGVAKNLYQTYPQVKELYHQLAEEYNTPTKRFGLLQPVEISDELIIINSFSQFAYGNSKRTGKVYTDEHVLMKNLKRCDLMAKEKNLTAYVPNQIGCGLAGGDWQRIRQFILKETDIIIVVKE